MQHSAAHVGVTDHKQEVVDEELEFYNKATVLAGASFIDCRSVQDQKAAKLPSKMIALDIDGTMLDVKASVKAKSLVFRDKKKLLALLDENV